MLELTRDLSVAINEYAPGSQVVAGGLRWTSGGVYRLPDRELVSRYYTTCDYCQHYREGVEPPDLQCPACHRFGTRQARSYVEPSFGFIATSSARQGAGSAPARSWNAATYIMDTHADVDSGHITLPGGRLDWRAGARGQFVVISEGPGKAGFRICQWCGWGAPSAGGAAKDHKHLLKGDDCRGSLRVHSLAHRYQTDFVELTFEPLVAVTATPAQLRSTVYALLEGAATALEISRDDIDGTVHRGVAGSPTIVLFDTTPGGAGNALRVARRLADVVEAAAARVRACECGVETSCYGCLRTYRNQRYHEELTRRDALTLVGHLLHAAEAVSVGADRR